MKRFIIAYCVAFALAGALAVACLSGALYIPNAHADNPVVLSRVAGKRVEVAAAMGPGSARGDGAAAGGAAAGAASADGFSSLELRAIDVTSSIPGHAASQRVVDRETWVRWFKQIRDTGANAVRVYGIESPLFYDALRAFNLAAEAEAAAAKDQPAKAVPLDARPLYLVQGVPVDDYAQNSHMDAFDDEFAGALEKNARDAVDVVHGARPTELDAAGGAGAYVFDVSKWTVAYMIGDEWVTETVVYTDKACLDRAGFAGDYLKTAPGATPFESMLARVGDTLLGYETSRYGVQRLLAFSCGAATDPLPWPDAVREIYGRPRGIDTERIRATAAVRSGVVTCYQAGAGGGDALAACSDEELIQLGAAPGAISAVRSGHMLATYLQLLNKHHAGPIMAGRLGAPSRRLVDRAGYLHRSKNGGMSEAHQAQELADQVKAVRSAGVAGSFVFEWQDDWSARAWNTLAAVDQLKAAWWNDVQTAGQGYGLMSFDPGEEPVCVIDGDMGEWEGLQPVSTDGGLSVRAAYDEAGLYIMVEGGAVDPARELFIALDTAPGVGSCVCSDPRVAFSSEADFLAVLAGGQKSRLLVHERYELERVTTLREILGDDPHLNPPAVDSDVFVTIDAPARRALSPDVVERLYKSGSMRAQDLAALRFEMVETGRLTEGDANPASPAYNSLADVAYGDHAVELRLPWGLLNFLNPAQMQVHADYYAHYGVDGQVIDAIMIGAAVSQGDSPDAGASGTSDAMGASGAMDEDSSQGDSARPDSPRRGTFIAMDEFPVKGWGGDVSYRERLKPAYSALQACWGGDAA